MHTACWWSPGEAGWDEYDLGNLQSIQSITHYAKSSMKPMKQPNKINIFLDLRFADILMMSLRKHKEESNYINFYVCYGKA